MQIVVNNPTLISVRFNVTPDAAGGTRIIKVTTLAGVGESSNAFSVKDTRAPSPSFSVDPSNGGKTTVFRFDASASSDPDGRIESYSWDFGDGRTASGRVVEHQYNSAGNFNVTLTVTDNENSQSSSSKNIEVKNTIPPIARYTVAPNTGSVDTVFRFDGSNSEDRDGRIVRYEWDFKDGTVLDGRVVHHKFERSDDFNVKLTVFDNEGLESFMEKEILVRGVPPVARIQVTPGAGDTSTNFRFDGTVSEDPDGDIVSFDWRFAGGTRFATPTFERRFPENGTYSVTLTVRDDDGMEDSTTEELAVGGGGSGDDDDDDGGGGGKCTSPSRQRTPYFFRVISADAGSKVIVGEFFEDVECSDVFYLCGDVRLGGIGGAKKYWMGSICEMFDLGNNRFRDSSRARDFLAGYR